jgi:hypothetical protein
VNQWKTSVARAASPGNLIKPVILTKGNQMKGCR